MEPIDRSKLRTVSAKQRHSKVNTGDFAKPIPADASFQTFFDSLPRILKAADLHDLAAITARAHKAGRGIVWGMGGHVVKVGLAPLLADLMQSGYVTALLLNGSAAIHDYEIALMGRTSEEVGPGVATGEFGMAEETGSFFAAAAEAGREIGFGEAIKQAVQAADMPHAELSVLAAAAKYDVPVTVHVAIGTDIVHMHPKANGAAFGAASHNDFLRLAAICATLDDGVYLNWGSAVIAPEVFVKAVTMQNNLRSSDGQEPISVTTANFDMLRHYRPRVNVVERPSSRGFDIAGHHEIMMPLFRMALLDASKSLRI